GATTQTVNNLPAGTYTVTVTDANGCTSTSTIVITEAPVLSLNTTQVNVLCTGGNTGSIDLTISGGSPSYTSLWSNGSTNQDLSNLSAGTYTVTVTDASNCVSSAMVTISQPLALTLSTTSTNATSGMMNGTAGTVASGGVPPYAYLWSQGGTSASLSGLGAGVYSVTVTDANGCMAVDTVTVESVGGLNTLNPELSVFVYPNPTQDKVYLSFGNTGISDGTIEVYAIDGKRMWVQGLKDLTLCEISMMNWANGMYRVSMKSNIGTAEWSVVKQ
ncbi:MAG: T9SS C-terminal target domain-containing protein, partial [Flavobacteriia bacterium]|nr:T9SS C-terminal target domain-containing protein [Flavobacteriia bacterium]